MSSTISFTQLAEQFTRAAAAIEELEDLKIKYKNLNDMLVINNQERFVRTDIVDELANLKLKYGFLQQVNKDLTQEILSVKNDSKKLEDKVQTLTEDLARCVDQRDDLEKQRGYLMERHEKQRQGHLDDIDDLVRENRMLTIELEDVKNKNSELIAALLDRYSVKQSEKKEDMYTTHRIRSLCSQVDTSRLKHKCSDHYNVTSRAGKEFRVKDHPDAPTGTILCKIDDDETFLVQGICDKGFVWGYQNNDKTVSAYGPKDSVTDFENDGWYNYNNYK